MMTRQWVIMHCFADKLTRAKIKHQQSGLADPTEQTRVGHMCSQTAPLVVQISYHIGYSMQQLYHNCLMTTANQYC